MVCTDGGNLNRKKKEKLTGEKIFSIVASLAIVAALVVGVISIVRATSNSKNRTISTLILPTIQRKRHTGSDQNRACHNGTVSQRAGYGRTDTSCSAGAG